MTLLERMPPQAFHHPREHSAARTREYVYAQLIPYVGNKRKLLPLITRGILLTGCRVGPARRKCHGMKAR